MADLANFASSWLPQPASYRLITSFEQHQAAALAAVSESDFLLHQNEAMLTKFFLEQAIGPSPKGPMTVALIERDFSGLESLQLAWRALSEKEAVRWIVLGLSFFDFRFHLFPVLSNAPFCISPMLCWCLEQDVIRFSGLPRHQFAAQQFDATAWAVGEQRLRCLELPLQIFGEPQECAEAVCEPATAKHPELKQEVSA